MPADGTITKQKILQVAKAQFAEFGFHATSVDRIAKAAKVNKAVIYYYFKDKNALITSLFQNIIDDLMEHVNAATANTTAPASEEEVHELLKQEIRFLEQHKDILSVALMEALRNNEPDSTLFRMSRIAIERDNPENSGSASEQRSSSPTAKYLVFDFFTAYMPMLLFVLFRERWCEYFHCDYEQALDFFVDSFTKTHIAAQPFFLE